MAIAATSDVQIDNDEVRVTEWRLAPGSATGHHRHEMDYVIVPVTDSDMTIVAPDGTRSIAQLRIGNVDADADHQHADRPVAVEHRQIERIDHHVGLGLGQLVLRRLALFVAIAPILARMRRQGRREGSQHKGGKGPGSHRDDRKFPFRFTPAPVKPSLPVQRWRFALSAL